VGEGGWQGSNRITAQHQRNLWVPSNLGNRSSLRYVETCQGAKKGNGAFQPDLLSLNGKAEQVIVGRIKRRWGKEKRGSVVIHS